jgi:hypothetical protein
MIAAAEDGAWRSRAGEAAVLHVRSQYTWDLAVDALLRGLFA